MPSMMSLDRATRKARHAVALSSAVSHRVERRVSSHDSGVDLEQFTKQHIYVPLQLSYLCPSRRNVRGHGAARVGGSRERGRGFDELHHIFRRLLSSLRK